MSGPTRPPNGGAPRQPWSPEQAPKGVTCPACGLANEAAARVCRNCGLPIASSEDPLRGVSPGHVDMPSAQRSGLSATVGLVLVVGLLLVAGTLAVSGGGILTSGGRLGANANASASPGPVASVDPIGGAAIDPPTDEGTDEDSDSTTKLGTKFGYTCEANGIQDLSRGKWAMRPFSAGNRASEGYDQVTFELARQGKKKAKKSVVARMEYMDPADARAKYGAPIKILGSRALIVTFDGAVSLNVGQTVDTFRLEPEGVDQIRNIQMFKGTDGKVHAAVGLRGDSCARMEAKGWNNKAKANKARAFLQVERFE